MTPDTPDPRPVSPSSELTAMSRQMLADPRFHGEACDRADYCSCGMTQNLMYVEAEAAARAAPQADAGLREAAEQLCEDFPFDGNLKRLREALAASPATPAGHRRSPEQDYDPTPICLLCFKAWDETGGILPEYRCPESPAARAASQPSEEGPAE